MNTLDRLGRLLWAGVFLVAAVVTATCLVLVMVALPVVLVLLIDAALYTAGLVP